MEIAELAKALTKFQNMKIQPKKEGKHHTFGAYLTLDDLIDAVSGPLADCGLCFTQVFDSRDIVTMLIHGASGQYIESRLTLPETASTRLDPAQALGSSITYCARYSLGRILGIATESDIDGLPQVPEKRAQTPNRVALQAQNNKRVESAPKKPTGALIPNTTPNGEYVIPFGKFRGETITNVGIDQAAHYAKYLQNGAEESGKPLSDMAKEFCDKVIEYAQKHNIAFRGPDQDDIPY